MIGRRGTLLVVLYVIFLAVLFLMCSTDLIIREPERESYQVAVIIEDVRGDNYGNFRKGMDQAAMEFNVDVHFITLYEKLDTKQQIELMDREQQDGADALIVVPADEEQIAGKQVNIPVVLLRSGITEGTGFGNVVTDYEEMGKQLAQEALRDVAGQTPVLMIADAVRQSEADRLFLQGASEGFFAAGHKIRTIRSAGERDLGDALDEMRVQTGEGALILAGNQDILTKTAGILADDPALAEGTIGLYGRGNTMTILNYLDQGMIKGICVTDDFGMGYLSVQTAIRALEGTDNPSVVMDSYYIEKNDLRDPDLEELLFPIE